MERTKRQQHDTVSNYDGNKKRKLQTEMTSIDTNKSLFENLANETIYEIFEYLDVCHIYDSFFNLNKRFENLFLYSNLPIQINISTISKSNFQRYHKNIIMLNKHRINFLRLSNPFTVDIVFSPPRIISKFLQLETLVLDHINARYLDNILKQLILLPKLHSLSLTLIDYVQDSAHLFLHIFRLPKLKFCKLNYQTKDDREALNIYYDEYNYSPIEHLVINTQFLLEKFDDLLCCLPRLRHLSIDCLVGPVIMNIGSSPIVLKHLKYVSLKLDYIYFNHLKKLIKYFFRSVEVLRLTTFYDETYLDAKRWKQLILSYMPNLRIFDIKHHGSAQNTQLTYHDLINRFNSSFWIERQWCFTHQHDWEKRVDTGIFYSTNPYRRKDYTFYWEFDKQMCSHLQENNLNTVKHVYICSEQATNNSINYFPNATELTIKNYFTTPDDSISTTLNRIVPLEQLSKLVIECCNFPLEEIVKLIRFTPNLHTLKLDLLTLDEPDPELFQQSETFRYVSNTNLIKHLELREWCILEDIQLILTLFPKLEYLKTRMYRQDIVQITRYLLSKTNDKTRRLFFLCISETPKICLRELNMLIKFEHLVGNYCIKLIDHDLYLWW